MDACFAAAGVPHRHPEDEGDVLHARRRDQGGRARHAARREHRRRLPRPLHHVPPGPRRGCRFSLSSDIGRNF